MIHIIQQSCLEKIRPDAVSFKRSYDSASVLVKEEFAYQIALFSDQEHGETVTFSKQIPLRSKLYLVKPVPVNWPHYSADAKEDYVLNAPGLLPDALISIDRRKTLTVNRNVTVIWVSITTDFPGNFDLSLRFTTDTQELKSNFTLHVLPNQLPRSDFLHTEYIDPWGIASAYRVPVYSDVFWDMLNKHLDLCFFHGINSILLPLFPVMYEESLPFKPTQLIRVRMESNKYLFDFDLLDSWMLQMKKCDIRNIVIPPIFPSLETMKCPPLMWMRFLSETPIFSRNATLDSPEYIGFMEKFLRQFIQHMQAFDFIERIDFQLTNDPRVEDEPAYLACRDAIAKVLKKQTVSNGIVRQEFHRLGHSPSLRIYLHDAARFPEEFKEVSFDVHSAADPCNLLIAAPAARLRAFGIYAYRHNITGLFNLGFNRSMNLSDFSPVDLYCETDYENSFPSGSCHLVYPGTREPVLSVRLKLLHFAIQDLRVLRLLERSVGRDRLVALIDRTFDFDAGEISPEALWNFREKLCSMIDKTNEV